MPGSNGSPLVVALDFIFHGPRAESNRNVRIVDYGNKAVFHDLWLDGLQTVAPTVDKVALDWESGDCSVLIVSDAAPDAVFEQLSPSLQGINFRDHLTATSWLAAWTVKFASDEHSKLGAQPRAGAAQKPPGDDTGISSAGPQAQIAVFDPWQPNHANANARSLQDLFRAKNPDGTQLIPRKSILNAPSLEDICRWLQLPKADTQDTPKHLLEFLKSAIWTNLTSDREPHHALSNVLGALLLRSQVGKGDPPPREPWIQDYLLALVQACGIEVDTDQIKVKENAGFQRWISPKMQQAIGAAVLIDDMADLWEYFLRGTLGFCGNAELPGANRSYYDSFVTSASTRCLEDIQSLPARLSSFLASGGPFLSADVLVPGTHRVKNDFVLFLDLRLFPKRGDDDGDLEKQFLKELAHFGLALLDSGRSLPWLDNKGGKVLLRRELTQLTGNAPRKAPSGSAFRVPRTETLLPRLVSLLDPTLPIVIFSSTHRSDLLEHFRDYANIITTFRKPIVSGMTRDWESIVTDLHADFATAIEQAAGVLRVRRAFHSFHQRVQQQTLIELPQCENGYLIELFLDESEDSPRKRPPRAVCAGGIVAIRSLAPNGSPLVSDDAIFQKLAENDCLWGWCANTPDNFARLQDAPPPRCFMPKGTDLDFGPSCDGPVLLEKMISVVQNAVAPTGCVIPVAIINNRVRSFPEWMALPTEMIWQMEKILDSTLRRLIQYAIEGLLFRSSVLRRALAHPKTRIAIDLGIRDYPCRPNQQITNAFGIEIWDDRWRPSLHSEDGCIITSATIARAGIPWPFKSRICRARAVALKDFGKYSSRPQRVVLPKQLHYLADAVAHVALHDLDAATGTSGAIAKFFESGWTTDLRNDCEAERRFAAGRAWDQNDCVWAFIEAARLRSNSPLNGIGIDLYRELAEGAKCLSPSHLSRLFRIL